MNEAASALGKLGKGIKKTITESERQRRREWGKKRAAALNAGKKSRLEKPAD